MKKVTVALALMMSIGLTGCANTDIFSGDVYEAGQAKERSEERRVGKECRYRRRQYH